MSAPNGKNIRGDWAITFTQDFEKYIIYAAVSYTHLDVYKRQPLNLKKMMLKMLKTLKKITTLTLKAKTLLTKKMILMIMKLSLIHISFICFYYIIFFINVKVIFRLLYAFI